MSVDPKDPVVAPPELPSAWPVPDWRPPNATPPNLGQGVPAGPTYDGSVEPPDWPEATPPSTRAAPADWPPPAQGPRDRLPGLDPSPPLHLERPTAVPDVAGGSAPSGLHAYIDRQPLLTPADRWSSAPSEVTAAAAGPDAVAAPGPIGSTAAAAPVTPAPVTPSPVTPAPVTPMAPAAAPSGGVLPGPGAAFDAPAVGSPPTQWRPDRLVKPKAVVPGRGVRRLLFKVTAGRLNLGQSAAEHARLHLVARVRTPAATGRRRVAFVSLKGGVGKTTTTVMLGHTLASYRGDNVIAIDANPDAGNLASRVPRQTPAASRDLLRAAGMLERYADVRAFTSQAGSRLQVLAGESDPALSEAFSAEDYSAVLGALERFYSIVLTDCGTGILHDAMRAVLWYADQLVIITSPALDSAQALNQLLEWLDRHGYHHLVHPAVVVVNAVRHDSEVGAREFESHFGPRCRAVVTVPYDRALSTGGEVDLTDLDAKTQRAYLDLAAAVADGFTTPRLEGH
jgi:MinD-like ATPase involved in chromosome partitioning or flagellar assembly